MAKSGVTLRGRTLVVLVLAVFVLVALAIVWRRTIGIGQSERLAALDAKRVQLVTSEARNPAARLIIVDTPYAVTLTNDLGQSRTVHTDGKEETVDIEGTPFGVTSRRDGDELVVTYRVGVNREIRYTYSTTANPKRLLVEVQFLEKGNGDKARRTYDSGNETGNTTAVNAAAGSASAPAAPADCRDRGTSPRV